MDQTVHVHLLANRVEPKSLADRTVVVIDVLRATTTIAYALSAGVEEVIPCGDVEEAWSAKQRDPHVLLGGERGGLPIEGFDLGNSPSEYVHTRVADHRVVFTTTNGTQAMLRCRQARRVLLAAFANMTAVVRTLSHEPGIELLCAGTRGVVSREDGLLAGAIVDGLQRGSSTTSISDEAALARDAWRNAAKILDDGGRLADILRDGAGGRNLMAIGLDRDIETAAEIDALSVVPELDIAHWCIRAGGLGDQQH